MYRIRENNRGEEEENANVSRPVPLEYKKKKKHAAEDKIETSQSLH